MSKKLNDNMGNISSAFDRSDDETQENLSYNNDHGYILHPPSTIYQNTQCIARRRVRRRRSRQMNSEMIGEENRNINRMHEFSSPNDNVILRPRRQTARRNVNRTYPTVQTVNTDHFYNNSTVQDTNDIPAPRRTQKRRGRRPKAFYCGLDGMNLNQNNNDVTNMNTPHSSNYESRQSCRKTENSNERTMACEEDDPNKETPDSKPQQVRKTKRRYRRRRKTTKQAVKANIKQEPADNSSVVEIPIDDIGPAIRIDEIPTHTDTATECDLQEDNSTTITKTAGEKPGKNQNQKNENPASDSEEKLYERLRAKWRSRSVRRAPRKRATSDTQGHTSGTSTVAKRRRTFRQTRRRRRTRNPAGKEKRQDTSTSADEIGKKSREHSEESTNFEENARYRLSHKAQPKRRRTRARPASSSEKERKTTRKVARKRHRRSATRSSEGDTGKETRREGSSSSSQEERATPRRKRRRAESQCSGTEGSTKKKTGGKRKTKTTNVQKNKNSNRKQSTDRKSQENKKHSQTPKRKS